MERVQGKDRKLWIPVDYLDPRLPTSGTSVGDDRRMSLIRKWLSGVSFSCLGVQAQACMRDSCPTFFSSHWVNLWLHSGLHCPWCYGGEGGNSKSRGGSLRAPARGPGPLAPSLRAGHPMKGEYPLQNPRSHPTLFYGHGGWRLGSTLSRTALGVMAERVGFEPTDRCRSTVFETARFGHSRTSPCIGEPSQLMVRGWSCLSR